MRSLFEIASIWKRWQVASRDPEAAQAEAWASTSELLAQGPFWAERWGATVPPLDDCPITTYADYAEATEGSFPETHSRLNGEPITHWVTSSGSSGVQKKFPWTASYFQQFSEASDPVLPVAEALVRLKGGRGHHHLAIIPPAPVRRSPAGVPIGYATAFTFPNDQSIYPDAANSDPDAIRWWRSTYALARDMRSLFSPTAEPIFRILEQATTEATFYRKALRGEIQPPEGCPPVQVTPERLAHLDRILGSPDLAPDVVWPALKLVRCWRAGTAGLQAARLQRRCEGDVVFADISYNATEGPIANPIAIDEVGGPLFAAGAIHEFLEPGASAAPENLLKPWELETGKAYEILLTTRMGMVRYRLGDLVQCTGWFHRVPKLRYHRRVSAELSTGATTYAEDELVRVLEATPLPEGMQAVFGPSADGRSLVLYTDGPLAHEVVEAAHQALARENHTYESLIRHSWSQRLLHRSIPGSAVWESLRAKHAMAKPKVLVMEPPA